MPHEEHVPLALVVGEDAGEVLAQRVQRRVHLAHLRVRAQPQGHHLLKDLFRETLSGFKQGSRLLLHALCIVTLTIPDRAEV